MTYCTSYSKSNFSIISTIEAWVYNAVYSYHRPTTIYNYYGPAILSPIDPDVYFKYLSLQTIRIKVSQKIKPYFTLFFLDKVDSERRHTIFHTNEQHSFNNQESFDIRKGIGKTETHLVDNGVCAIALVNARA